MIAPMFWNLCKSSWRRGLYFLLLGVVFLLVVQEAKSSRIRNCGRVFEGHSLSKGKEAGLFKKLNRTKSLEECIKDCCNDRECKTALFVGHLQACYTVDCKTPEACRPVPVSKASKNYKLSVFQRDSTEKQNTEARLTHPSVVDDPNRPLIREKRHKSCHHYHGTQSGCKEYLKNKLLYFNGPPSLVEKRLIMPLRWLRVKLSQNCQKYAVAAICHYAFPHCADRLQPAPTFLCHEDCMQLYTGVCKNDFTEAVSEGHGGFLPDCKTLPSSREVKCIKLNIPESLPPGKMTPTASASLVPSQHSHSNSKSDKANSVGSNTGDDDNDLDIFKEQINQQSGGSDKPSLKGNILPSSEQNMKHDDTNEEKNDKSDSRDLSNEGKQSETGAETDTNSKINNLATTLPSLKSAPSQNIGTSSNSVEEEDLNTPKRSNISENKSGDKDHKELKNDREKSSPKSTDTPSSAVLPSKPLGLGLKKSLSLLEPTAPTGKLETNSPERMNEATPSPTAVSPTASRHAEQTSFVNVTDNDHINLEIADTPAKGHNATVTATKPTPTQSQITDHTVSRIATSNGPTKAVTGVNNTDTTVTPTKATTGAATTKPTPTEAPPTLQVSAGHNKILTLPTNSIELYASAYPKETVANPYTYTWQQISAPQDSHGYMEGKDTRRVILSKLSHVGVYQFKVTVKGTANGAFGFASVNVTVRPVPRVNKPPRADISPKEQFITLPTNGVVLDGSKSSDDDKIIQYKWEEVKGPLNDKNKMISSGADSPVLQLKSLVPGIYTFKLTVVDSDDEKDSTTATVTVNDEKDYPPVARAGNDVVLTLPVNHVTLNGNSSTDNKGIVSYEWSKAPSSPAVGDMQGTNSPFLKVSNMVVGDYTFLLKVTDTGGLTSTSKVTVVVQPEKNMAPVAKAGSDKDLVFPDDSTTLDANESHDDQKIVKYHWAQESGPSTAEISGADEKVVTVKKLQEGHYVFKLIVTDDKGLTGTDTVAVNVKKDINQAPVSNAGPDVVVHLPNRAAELDGSKSSDDHGIAKYIWLRDPKSPAAGDVINNSDHQATLRLSNLVEGMYKFKLTVLDAKGLKSSDEALLTVKEDENSAHLVELYLDVDITRFTEENKGQLIRKLAVILDVQDDDIVVEHLKEAGTGHSMMVMFYVKGGSVAKDGPAIAETLKAKIENEEGFFEFRMLKVEPYICRNNCSFHGYCDRRTKLCVCESFWMQDIFKSSFGVKESNCDWSILYVTVIIFGIVMGIGGIVWAVCFCLGRISRRRRRRDNKVVSVEPPLLSDSNTAESHGRQRGRSRRRHRYAIIDEDDDDKAESMEMLPKHKYSSLTLTDSDEDSDETTLFEAKKRIPNGAVNGSIGRKAM